MPELLNNILETELLEGFMHQLYSEETEEKLSHLFARTVVDTLTLQPNGRAFYSDILWALLLEKCLQRVKLFAGSITRLMVAHRQPLRGCTILNFCLFQPLFSPQGFPSTWDWRHPHRRRQALLSKQGVLGCQTQLQEPYTAWGSWQWEGNETAYSCFKRKYIAGLRDIRKVRFLTFFLTIRDCYL